MLLVHMVKAALFVLACAGERQYVRHCSALLAVSVCACVRGCAVPALLCSVPDEL